MFTRKVLLNTLCEFGPIIAFLIGYELSDFQSGTLAMMLVALCALVVLQVTEGHLPVFALISTATVLLFGGISIFVHIPSIFILRDTIFDLIFGIALIVSVLLKKPALKPIFKNVFHITNKGWTTLSLRWGIFFICIALVNEWVRRELSPDDWVLVKVLILFGTVIFGAYQFTLTRREREDDATAWGIRK